MPAETRSRFWEAAGSPASRTALVDRAKHGLLAAGDAPVKEKTRPRDIPEPPAGTAKKFGSTAAAAASKFALPPPPKTTGKAAEAKGDGKAAAPTFSFTKTTTGPFKFNLGKK
jgi:hypothetical protein